MFTYFRKPATVAKHTGKNESDISAEVSENEGATSDNLSDSNTGSASKGMNFLQTVFVMPRYCQY